MNENIIETKKQRLAESVGEIIKYWGFKEIHGRIWVHIYLSKDPITAKDLTEKLGVTKGLISMMLSELVAYQVIQKVNIGNAKSPGYQSNPDLLPVIHNIVRNRELQLTTNIQENIHSLAQVLDNSDSVMLEKLNKLEDMTSFAIECLTKMLDNKTIATDRFKMIMKLIP